MSITDEELMAEAITEAQLAEAHGDVPVGAVVAIDGQIVSRRHNERELTNDPTAHAEVLALRDAAAVVGSWRLETATLAVTLEPCVMCAGALWSARVSRVVFGAFDAKAGACQSLYNVGADPRLNHEFDIRGGVEAEKCAQLLHDLFSSLRSQT